MGTEKDRYIFKNAINKKYSLGLLEFANVSDKELKYQWTVIAAYK